ncbi:MAG: hypothetical protein IJQ76_09135 [Prevotella sp.]|nr:hypothetical protein [Prevotella sp.]
MIHNHSDKVKRTVRAIQTLGLLLFLPFMTACYEYDESDRADAQQTVPLTFYIQTAGQQQTRGYIGDLAADPADEKTINDVKVWLYKGTTFVDYTEDIDANNEVTMNVPQAIVSEGSIDVYVIANAESAGLGSLNGSTSLEVLTKSTIDKDKFSTTTPVTVVPNGATPFGEKEKGLPMSIVKKGCRINAENLPATLETVKITRAVSKIYFAFGMYEGDFGEILGISLEGSEIANHEFILPVDYAAGADDYKLPYWGDLKAHIKTTADDGETDDFVAYEQPTIIFGSTDGTDNKIAVPMASVPKTQDNADPANYTWANWLDNQQDSTDYYTAIAHFITHRIYLHESDKKLKGKIYYRYRYPKVVNGEQADSLTEPRSVDFEMAAPTEATETNPPTQDFARNHVWIVYCYFEGGKLYVKPTVAPWNDVDPLNYTLKMSTQLRLFDSWLYRYDTDGKYGSVSPIDPTEPKSYDNWEGSHMVVSDGRVTTATETEQVAGRPLRSPQIQLVTTGEYSFDLTLDNTANFEIIKAVKNDAGEVVEYAVSNSGKLNISEGDNVYTYFYIAPKDNVTWTNENRVAKVSLIYNDEVVAPQKVTFNYNSLPGYSDDSSEIWVYYVDEDDYNIDGKIKMYYQDYNNPLVPTPVQN